LPAVSNSKSAGMTKPTAQIIDGKALAELIFEQFSKTVARLPHRPSLAAIMIGDDKASQLFIKRKKLACRKVGITFHEYQCGNDKCLPNITADGVLEMIDWLNNDDQVDAIIVQLPIPKKFDTETIIQRISPAKDVDGFHAENTKKLLGNTQEITPPLILAIQAAIGFSDKLPENQTVIIISKNPIFSQPLARVLQRQGFRLNTVLPDDPNVKTAAAAADVVISVVGKKYFVKADMVKPDALVIDVGTTLEDNNGTSKLYGDVDPGVKKVAGWLTPVPGGIGPLTVAMLLKNVVELAAKKQGSLQPHLTPPSKGGEN